VKKCSAITLRLERIEWEETQENAHLITRGEREKLIGKTPRMLRSTRRAERTDRGETQNFADPTQE
jgi:hypothetical protein